jgi:hypothetical protein
LLRRNGRASGLFGLAGYGTMILSFLGRAHWGLALHAPPAKPDSPRLGFGLVPALIDWGTLMLPSVLGASMLATDIPATTGWNPDRPARAGAANYLRLRWPLSLSTASYLSTGAMAATIGRIQT